MEYRVLGPLEVTRDDGGRIRFGPRERKFVTALLLLAWTPVSRDTLARAVWGDKPPADVPGQLRLVLFRARAAMGMPAGRRCLRSLDDTYLANPAREDFDLGRFWDLRASAERLVQAGALRPASAALRDALACWREPGLAGLPEAPAVDAQRARLIEERHLTELACADVLLELGDHERILPWLHGLAIADPLGERAWAQFMLALYQSGRREAALGAYSKIRAELIRAYGTEPGAELQDLLRLIRDQVPPASRYLPPPLAGGTRRAQAPAGGLTACSPPRPLKVPGTITACARRRPTATSPGAPQPWTRAATG